MEKYILIFLFFLPQLSYSQVINIEEKRQSYEKKWTGKTKFSFDFNKSQKVNIEFDNTTYVQFNIKNFSILFLNEIDFDRAGGIDFQNDGFQHLRINKSINKTYSLEAYVQNQFNPVRKILNRKLMGLGVRFNHKNNNFLGISSFYEVEKIIDGIIYNDVRLSSYIFMKYDYDKYFSFFTTTYCQPKIDYFKDVKISSEMQLNFVITKKLSLNSAFEIVFDSYPAKDVERLIYNFKSGITIDFN